MVHDADVYVPGSWICRTCGRRYLERDTALVRVIYGCLCPEDHSVMRRETYRESLASLMDAMVTLVAEKERLTIALDHALERIRAIELHTMRIK